MELAQEAADSPRLEQPRGEPVQTAEDVAAMLRLHDLGWGARRVARELGCSRTTVQHDVAAGGWRSYRRGGRVLACRPVLHKPAKSERGRGVEPAQDRRPTFQCGEWEVDLARREL